MAVAHGRESVAGDAGAYSREVHAVVSWRHSKSKLIEVPLSHWLNAGALMRARVSKTHPAASIHARFGPARGNITRAWGLGIAHRQVDAAAVARAHHMRIMHAHMRMKNPIEEGKTGVGVEERVGREVEGGHGVLRGLFQNT
jgi:hypothetical protein